MRTIRCILIDDEPKAITALSYEVQRIKLPEAVVFATFTRARDALKFLSSPSGKGVDIVFLDIEMTDLDGLTFLDAFPNRDFDVIFTTAHSQYAIEAIRKDAFDYLVKPVDREELQSALERWMKRQASSGASEPFGRTEKSFFENGEIRIRFEIDRKILFVDPGDILYCEGDGNYCHVYLEHGGSLLLTRQLKAIDSLLPSKQFIRTHRSYVVNLHKIKEYHRASHHLVLINGKHIPVSRQLRKYFT